MIRKILDKPSLYFGTLTELEFYMSGHAAAYESQNLISRQESFGYSFANWILDKAAISGAGGWARSVKEYSVINNILEADAFHLLVREFLQFWTAT